MNPVSGRTKIPKQATVLPGGRIELRDYAAWDVHLHFWRPPRKVCLWIHAVGYEFGEVEIHDSLRRGEQTELDDIVLKRIPKTQVLVVGSTGQAIPGAELRLTKHENDWRVRWAYEGTLPKPGTREWNFPHHRLIIETNEKGEGIVSKVESGNEMISVSHPDYAFTMRGIDSANPNDQVAMIRLAPAGKIRVLVVDEFGQPAPWRPVFIEALDNETTNADELAEIRGYRLESRSNADGLVTFERLSGRFLVALQHPEHGRRPESHCSPEERAVVLVDGDDVDVTLTAWAVHDVSVSIRESDRPIVNASLHFLPEYLCTDAGSFRHTPWRGFTSDQGHFRFRDIPPGDYVLLVNHDDRNMVSRRRVHVGPRMETIEWLLDNNTISGKLVDSAGIPISYKCIGIETELPGYCSGNHAGITYESGYGGLEWFWSGPWIHETWTDVDGNFHLRGLAANIPISLYTSHNALTKTKLELEPLQDGEHRQGVVLVSEQAGSFRMVHTSKLPQAKNTKYRALMYPLDSEGKPVLEKKREQELPYPHPIKSCVVGPWRIEVQRANGEAWAAVLQKDVTVVAGETQEVTVIAIDD